MIKSFMILIIGWGMALFAASPIDSVQTLSFTEARELILFGNAGLKSVQTETDAAKAGVTQAGVYPNPGIGVALDKFGVNEFEVGVEQTIELGGKRKLRTEVAQKNVEAVINAGKLTRLELETEIIRRFIPIVTTMNKLTVVDSILKITDATGEQIQRRVDAGGSRMTDLVRIEIEIEKLELEHIALVRENVQARLNFAALGSTQDSLLKNVSGELDNDLPIPDLVSLQKVIDENPALSSYTIERASLESERNLLQAEVTPDLNLSAGYLRSNADDYHSPLLGVSMVIPLFNKNTAAKQQVDLKQKAVSERLENVRHLLIADIQEIYSQLGVIDLKLKSLQSSVIPKAQRVYTMLNEYYNAGNAGFLDLAEAQADLLRLKLELVDIQEDRALKLADLMQNTAINMKIVK